MFFSICYQMEEADTSQILDMAVSFLRETRRPQHLARSHPFGDVTRMTSSTVPRVLPPPPMAPLSAGPVPAAYSEADLHKLVENQREMDMALTNMQEDRVGQYPHGVLMMRAAYDNPEGLLLRNLDHVLRGGHIAIMGPRGAYWRPW